MPREEPQSLIYQPFEITSILANSRLSIPLIEATRAAIPIYRFYLVRRVLGLCLTSEVQLPVDNRLSPLSLPRGRNLTKIPTKEINHTPSPLPH